MENDWMEEAAIGIIRNARLSRLLWWVFLFKDVKVKVTKNKDFAYLSVSLMDDVPLGVQMRIVSRPIDYGISFYDFMKVVVPCLQYVLADRFRIPIMISGVEDKDE